MILLLLFSAELTLTEVTGPAAELLVVSEWVCMPCLSSSPDGDDALQCCCFLLIFVVVAFPGRLKERRESFLAIGTYVKQAESALGSTPPT